MYKDPCKYNIWEDHRILAYSILILSQQYWWTNKQNTNKSTKANISKTLGCSPRFIEEYAFKGTLTDWNESLEEQTR